MSKYYIGGVYYRVTYPDMTMRYPGIASLVYIGKNLLTEDHDEEETLYFQPARDFAVNGSALVADSSGRQVEAMKSTDPGRLLDEDELLIDCAEQRHAGKIKGSQRSKYAPARTRRIILLCPTQTPASAACAVMRSRAG